MTEPTTDAPAETAAQPAEAPGVEELQAQLERVTAEARKWESRSKENHSKLSDLEKAQRASMTEHERALADAEKRGAQTAAQQFSQRLVRSEFTALARGRNPGYDVAAVLDDLNLARYITEDGEADAKALSAAVERLVPPPDRNTRPIGNADLGARDSGRPQDMNSLIRSRVGR